MRGDDGAPFDETAYLVEVDSLRGIPVFSSSGKMLGVLEGVVISKDSGAITYVVLCCSGLMGLRKKRHVLPQDALTLDAELGGFAVVDAGFALVDKATKEPKRAALRADKAQHRLDPARSV
jgi:sporulation protein YlmC with PRC-barrel domain